MIAHYLSSLILIYIVLIFIRILCTWSGSTISHRIQGTLAPVVDPYLLLIQRVIPAFGPVDFSPTIGVILLLVLQNFVLQLKF